MTPSTGWRVREPHEGGFIERFLDHTSISESVYPCHPHSRPFSASELASAIHSSPLPRNPLITLSLGSRRSDAVLTYSGQPLTLVGFPSTLTETEPPPDRVPSRPSPRCLHLFPTSLFPERTVVLSYHSRPSIVICVHIVLCRNLVGRRELSKFQRLQVVMLSLVGDWLRAGLFRNRNFRPWGVTYGRCLEGTHLDDPLYRSDFPANPFPFASLWRSWPLAWRSMHIFRAGGLNAFSYIHMR